MSLALAAVNPAPLSTWVQATLPTVLVDGIPEPNLHVTQLIAMLEHDRRSATLHWIDADARNLHNLLGKTATVIVPHLLIDGETRCQVLVSGSVSIRNHDRSVGNDQSTLIVLDQLSTLLDQPIDVLGYWPHEGLSLGDLLARLASLLPAAFVGLCDEALLTTPLEAPAQPGTTLGDALTPSLSALGLRLMQTLSLERDQVRRTLGVTPATPAQRSRCPGRTAPVTAGRSSQSTQAPHNSSRGRGSRRVIGRSWKTPSRS